jgi:hypothetical protein
MCFGHFEEASLQHEFHHLCELFVAVGSAIVDHIVHHISQPRDIDRTGGMLFCQRAVPAAVPSEKEAGLLAGRVIELTASESLDIDAAISVSISR